MWSWNESLQFGPREFAAMALAHGIILGIAFFRYVVRPWWTRRTATHSAESE